MTKNTIEIYTDGSCNTKSEIGAWAAILFFKNQRNTIMGVSKDTTNNRMELTAVIKSIEYLIQNKLSNNTIKIYTDSQYVEKLPQRANKLESTHYITKKGNELPNTDLIKQFLSLLNVLEVELIKVKAHQKTGNLPNYNREVDKMCRKIVREQMGIIKKSRN